MKRRVIFSTLVLGIAFGLTLLVACGQSQASTPQTRDFTMVTVPLLVKESTGTFDFLNKDFAPGGCWLTRKCMRSHLIT
jgi:hypothetical protein